MAGVGTGRVSITNEGDADFASRLMQEMDATSRSSSAAFEGGSLSIRSDQRYVAAAVTAMLNTKKTARAQVAIFPGRFGIFSIQPAMRG